MLDQIDLRNIKDLLESTVTASEKRIKKELRAEIVQAVRESEERVVEQINDLSQSVAEALDITNSTIEPSARRIAKQEIKKHERRFHGLKTFAA